MVKTDGEDRTAQEVSHPAPTTTTQPSPAHLSENLAPEERLGLGPGLWRVIFTAFSSHICIFKNSNAEWIPVSLSLLWKVGCISQGVWLLISNRSQRLEAWTAGTVAFLGGASPACHCGNTPSSLPASNDVILKVMSLFCGFESGEVKKEQEHLGGGVLVVIPEDQTRQRLGFLPGWFFPRLGVLTRKESRIQCTSSRPFGHPALKSPRFLWPQCGARTCLPAWRSPPRENRVPQVSRDTC